MSNVLYCGQCGTSNPDTNKFCGKCGSVLIPPAESQEESGNSDQPKTAKPNACPKCLNNDQIQKLSTIVSAGTLTSSGVATTSGETKLAGDQRHYVQQVGYVGSSTISGNAYSKSSTEINVTEQTALVKKLSLSPIPQEPVLQKIGISKWFVWIFLIVGSIIWTILAEHADFLSPIDNIYEVVIVIVVMFFFGRFLSRTLDRTLFEPQRIKASKQYSLDKSTYDAEFSAWKAAKERWNKMYYCHRDDVIFIPGENVLGTPEQLEALCFKK
jgi:DNA-directed RNA polymerase subunit M/transcription elongation factor TFIIS